MHPASGAFVQRHADEDLAGAVLHLMCDDLRAAVATLEGKNVPCAGIREAEWGTFTTVRLPSGGSIGLYQPAHQTALGLES